MMIKDIGCAIKTRHIVKSVSGEIAGTTVNFIIVFFEDCEMFFRTLGPLCTCPSIWAGCIDWFRNRPRAKQIYRIIVKKKTTRPLCRNGKQRTSAAIALNFAITVHHIVSPGKSRHESGSQVFCRKSFQRIDKLRTVREVAKYIIRRAINGKQTFACSTLPVQFRVRVRA